MIDINYYMTGQFQKKPVVYNIETTNLCKMECDYCPRSLMRRPAETMEQWVFDRVAEQIDPWSDAEWQTWKHYSMEHYGIPENEVSENGFFLYIIPRVITLHGFGEPLLDPYIAERVFTLSNRDIPSYISTRVYDFDKVEKLFNVGLSYLKFSLYSDKIYDVVKLRDKWRYETQIVLSLVGQKVPHIEGVYAYGKSQDQVWYKRNTPVRSIHWSEPCKYPLSSLSVQSNGDVVACSSDYNSELVMGDAKTEMLWNVWNGEKYKHFRECQTKYERCVERCDRRIRT